MAIIGNIPYFQTNPFVAMVRSPTKNSYGIPDRCLPELGGWLFRPRWGTGKSRSGPVTWGHGRYPHIHTYIHTYIHIYIIHTHIYIYKIIYIHCIYVCVCERMWKVFHQWNKVSAKCWALRVLASHWNSAGAVSGLHMAFARASIMSHPGSSWHDLGQSLRCSWHGQAAHLADPSFISLHFIEKI